MAKAANKLQKSFLGKEETEKFVVNLEKLKSEALLPKSNIIFLRRTITRD